MSFNNSDSQDSYIIDDPVDTKDEDRLERYPIAERIVKTIVSRKDKSSFVLGIYGAWGEGKSTVLNFVDNIFDREYKSSVCCIKFNPWYFRDEDQLLSNFFELLADKLDGGIILNRERMGKYSKDYLAKLIPPTTLKLVGVDLGEMFNRWGGLLSDVSLDERKKNLEQFLEGEKKKIVIIIDDVDRLDKNEIQTVLKLVKLLANFKHTTYILAFDDNVVAAAIGDSYSGNKDLGKDLGKGFLEKIVQVPIPLPKLSRDSLKSFCFEKVKQVLESLDISLTEDEWVRFKENFESGLSIRVQTIRMVKRYINTLIFSLPLIKNEVNTVDFLLLEGMRVFYPPLYSDISDKPSEYLNLNSSDLRNDPQYRKIKLDSLTENWHKLTNGEISAKNLLFCLFPEISNIFRGEERIDWIIARESVREQKLVIKQRVCTEEYFGRFFEYKIPNYDISDLEIDELFKQIAVSGSNYSQVITKFFKQDKADAFVLKVTNRLKDLSPVVAQELAITLSKLDSHLFSGKQPKSIRFQFVFSLPRHLQDLVYKLVGRVSELKQRFILLEKIINEGELYPFVINFFEYAISDEHQWVSSEQEEILGKVIAKRIIHHFEKASIFEHNENICSLITILIRFGIKEENHKLFKAEINRNAGNVLTLLSCFYFLRNRDYNFSELIQLVNIEIVYNAIPENLKESVSSTDIVEKQNLPYNSFLKWFRQTYSDQNLTIAAIKFSEASFSKVWDNPEDTEYNNL
jgi:hypothetical protein